jgi:cytochrome b561
MDQPQGYSRAQILLHWLTVALVAYNLIIDNSMRPVLRATAAGQAPDSGDLWMANLHAWIGIAIFGVVAYRLTLRLMDGVPPPPADESTPLQWAAKASHWLFYILLFALPITGTLAYFGGYDQMGDLHGEVLKTALWVVIAAHAAAALWHHFYKRDNVLRRMLRSDS